MRGRDQSPQGAIRLNQMNPADSGAHRQTAVIRRLMDRPAVIAAVAVGPSDSIPTSIDGVAPILMSVKFIDDRALSRIATQLRLTNLRKFDQDALPIGDFGFDLNDPDGKAIGCFAWTPKRPGAEIVHNVVPFIAVALIGLALLAAFVLRYMRRTAAAIAAGETRLRHLAMHDPLCGLPNRIYFGERLEAVIEEVRGGTAPAAVFYIDLDHFKDVNDTLGHRVGDELIRNVTLRLSHTLRGGELVARLGGDEFAVISSIAGDSEQMMGLAQRIIAAICAPYIINGHNIIIGVSLGIAMVDNKCGTATDIMRYADMALYRAKNEGRNRACIYDAAMDADLFEPQTARSRFARGDRERPPEAFISARRQQERRGRRVEAFCRWTHPTRSEIPPSEFIAIAEHSGLIIELGNWVLRRACMDGKAWPDLTIAVNVSSLQFRRIDFVEVVEKILKETRFNPARLELELTESVLLGNVDTAEAAMARLKALGVRVALDDFGTGYSSLLYLRRFPFDKLKIDRSFVRSIEKAADAAAIVHAIVSLGRGLGMQMTARGVETADQQLFLRAVGVHSMQGFRFGRPVTVAEISARLQSPAAYLPIEVIALAS